MASQAHTTPARSLERDWIIHHGVNAPVPSGTKIEAELFGGDRLTFITGTVAFDEDGNAEPQNGPALWSAWKFRDGGPTDAKIRAYRILGGAFVNLREEALEMAR